MFFLLSKTVVYFLVGTGYLFFIIHKHSALLFRCTFLQSKRVLLLSFFLWPKKGEGLKQSNVLFPIHFYNCADGMTTVHTHSCLEGGGGREGEILKHRARGCHCTSLTILTIGHSFYEQVKRTTGKLKGWGKGKGHN